MKKTIGIIYFIFINFSIIKANDNCVQNQYQKFDYKMYSSELFSIKYPSSWKCVEHPHETMDVYFGDENRSIGFSILCLETEYNIDDIKNEAISNIKSVGCTLENCEKVLIKNMVGYKITMVHNVGFDRIQKSISYTLKKDNIVYYLNFSGEKYIIDENIVIINTIINSLSTK